jgi:hypothetical protein
MRDHTPYEILPFEDWAQFKGWLRASFWRTQGFANLQRARDVHWTYRRRWWSETAVGGWMVDLEAESPPSSLPPRRRTKKKLK